MVRGARAAALCVAAAAAARWCAFVLAPLPVGEPARPLDDGAYDLVDVAAPATPPPAALGPPCLSFFGC